MSSSSSSSTHEETTLLLRKPANTKRWTLLGIKKKSIAYNNKTYYNTNIIVPLLLILCGMVLVSLMSFTYISNTAYSFDNIDVLIIGGGPAGSVVAKRISDDSSMNVLLIEAGGLAQELKLTNKASPSIQLSVFDIPYYWSVVANTAAYHWDLPNVLIAKALGGCGIHNAMLYGM